MNCACEGSECRKVRSGLPLTPNDGELCNYSIMYHNAVIIKFTINIMHMNHFKTMPTPPSTSSRGKWSSMKLVPVQSVFSNFLSIGKEQMRLIFIFMLSKLTLKSQWSLIVVEKRSLLLKRTQITKVPLLNPV